MKDYKVIYLIVIVTILAFISVYYMDKHIEKIQTKQEQKDSSWEKFPFGLQYENEHKLIRRY